jgi:ABC-2 type transport system ATP-binding protein
MQDGRILSIEKPENIIKSFNKKLFALKSSDTYNLLKMVEKSDVTDVVYPFGEFLHAIFKEDFIKEEFLKQLISEGLKDIIIQEEEPTIEDCFMDLMRKK